MRAKIAAGNWKMNCTHEEAVNLTDEILNLIKNENTGEVKIVLAPPFVHLGMVRFLVKDEKRIFLSAQNCAAHESGAFTGEVSAAMVRSVGAQYVIIGHSERRNYFNETNEQLSQKTRLAIQHQLIPIFCCGETSEERKSNTQFHAVKRQLDESIFILNENDFRNLVIAYEPVWAIGTGLTATPRQAQEMHQYIRSLIAARYSPSLSESVSILYGGSCNEKNAQELFEQPDIDGGLIGGASLKADGFFKIIKSFK